MYLTILGLFMLFKKTLLSVGIYNFQYFIAYHFTNENDEMILSFSLKASQILLLPD